MKMIITPIGPTTVHSTANPTAVLLPRTGDDDERGETLQRPGDFLALGKFPLLVPQGERPAIG